MIEHGGGSGAAYPIARDVMTFLFDPAKAMDALTGFEAGWGGTPQQRQAARYSAYAAQYGVKAPKPVDAEEALSQASESDTRGQASPQPEQTAAAAPRPEEDSGTTAVPSPGPAPSPAAAAAGPAPTE